MTTSNTDLNILACKYNIPLDSVVSKDMLEQLPLHHNLILNLQDLYNSDGTTNGGSHWIALTYRKKHNTWIFFDSYGLVPPSDVINYVYKHTPRTRLIYNTRQVQRFVTSTCGWYSLAFLLYCLKHPHLNPEQLVEKFVDQFEDAKGQVDLMHGNKNLQKLLSKFT